MEEILRSNRDRVLAQIADAARDAERDPSEIELVAVTKKVSADVALALRALGQEDLGEARIDSLEEKQAAFAAAGASARWHFIGHLQRNKAARVVRAADVIHSVDTLALLEAIERHAECTERRPEVYLQVKLADEEAKYGFSPDTLVAAVDRAAELDHVETLGLMAMAPWIEDETARREAARDVFERLADIAVELPALGFRGGSPRLSMGMSGDLTEAVAAGTDAVRIGTALFEGLDAANG